MSSEAEHERIKNRKTRLERERERRVEENPVAFGWEKTESGKYVCGCCEKPYGTLAGCLRHIAQETRDVDEETDQSSLGEW